VRYVLGPVISWPALNLGRVRAEVVAAQAREAAGRAEYSRVVLAAMEEMEKRPHAVSHRAGAG